MRSNDEQRYCCVEWVRELGSGSFRSRSHLINHVDMVIRKSPEDEQPSRMAIIRVDGEQPWRRFARFDEDAELKRARNHILVHSSDCTGWSQLQIAVKEDELGEPDWDASLPIDCTDEELLDIIRDAIEVWAEMEGVSEDVLYESSSCFVLLPIWGGIVLDRIEVASFGISDKPMKMNDRQVMARGHANSRAWRQFAIGICGSDRMKDFLRQRQNSICPVCGRKLDGTLAIHHVDYDHECSFSDDLEERFKPTCLCDACAKEQPERFEDCSARLRMVHTSCNWILEGVIATA